jgi:hypothetical protein
MACLHKISKKSVQWFPNFSRWTQVEETSHVRITQSVYKVSGLDSQKIDISRIQPCYSLAFNIHP